MNDDERYARTFAGQLRDLEAALRELGVAVASTFRFASVLRRIERSRFFRLNPRGRALLARLERLESS
jgi:hypothetical protein